MRITRASTAGLLALGCWATAMAAEKQIPNEIEKTEELISSARELRDKLCSDPHRPMYHFMPREAWMNDINGAIFWKGRWPFSAGVEA